MSGCQQLVQGYSVPYYIIALRVKHGSCLRLQLRCLFQSAKVGRGVSVDKLCKRHGPRIGYRVAILETPLKSCQSRLRKNPDVQPLTHSEQPLTGGYECLVLEVTLTGRKLGSPFYCLSLYLPGLRFP